MRHRSRAVLWLVIAASWLVISPDPAKLGLVGSAVASDITITGQFNFRNNRSANPVGVLAGDILQVGAISITPSGAGTTATATQGATTLNLEHVPQTAFPNQYSADIAFDPTLTGAWSINAADPSGTLSVLTNSIPSPQLLPTVTSIQVVGTGVTPTITWILPDLTGFDPDRIQARVWDLDHNSTPGRKDLIFVTNLGAAATSFLIPANILKPGGHYAFDVTIDDLQFPAGAPAFLENRSEAFSGLFSPVPEPGSLWLLATGLGALSIVGQRLRRRGDPGHGQR